ncbi:unnamed protein product [Closterium sp. Yama58-4]|nr:unnamed protein product [Closterium sp. Yama58-4]
MSGFCGVTGGESRLSYAARGYQNAAAMAVVEEARAEAINEERRRAVEEKTVLSCTTFNVLAPIYKRMGVESERESACQHVWRERNQEIIRTLLDTKSSILCLQECWLANPEWVDMYDTELHGAGYQLLKLPRTNARGDEEHHAGALPIILCGDLNGTKQGNVYKLLRAHGFVSSFDSAHHHSDDDEQWVSHRNHHGNLCGVDYVWVLNPEQHHRALAVNWRTAVFGLIRSKLASAGITNVEAAFDFFLQAGEGRVAEEGVVEGWAAAEARAEVAESGCERRRECGPAAFSMGDFQRGLDRLGLTGVDSIGLTRFEVEELMRSADCQGKGCVDFEDFKALFDQPTWDDTVAALRHSLATSCSVNPLPPPAESTPAGAADVHRTASDVSSASTNISIASADVSSSSSDISSSPASGPLQFHSSPQPSQPFFLICTSSAISHSLAVASQMHAMGKGGVTEGRVGGATEREVKKEQLGNGTMQRSSGREGRNVQHQSALNLDVLQASLFPRAMEEGVWPEDYTISDHAVLTVRFGRS